MARHPRTGRVGRRVWRTRSWNGYLGGDNQETIFVLRDLQKLVFPAVLGFAALTTPSLAQDRDYNPPGRQGGPGTNWENPPGPRAGPGASPDRILRYGPERYVFNPRRGSYFYNARFGYWHPDYGWWNQAARCWFDRDGNPPGPVGGLGTNWENPPGLRGGRGRSPDRFGRCQ